jgi:hypothetical protein
VSLRWAVHVALTSGRIQCRKFCNHDSKKSGSLREGNLRPPDVALTAQVKPCTVKLLA